MHNIKPRWMEGLSLLVLRCFAAYEFGEAGLEKWRGNNWFAEIQDRFPFPFSLLPPDWNWYMAMGAELLFPLLLLIGLIGRFSAAALSVLTLVAWYAVHSGLGYNISNGGYKMAVIYLVVLLPIMLMGSGSFSLDYHLKKRGKCLCRLKSRKTSLPG